jgi:hypothetical protein
MPNETDARIIIDRLLRDAEWDIEDKAQVSTEGTAADGRADYVLKDSRSRPLAVIEAKRFSILGLKALENIQVPVPPFEKQVWFDALVIKLNAIRAAQLVTQQELNALMLSVLDRAFRGEL